MIISLDNQTQARPHLEESYYQIEMKALYLRYRNSDPDQLSNIMTSVVEILIVEKVLRRDRNELRLLGKMTRLQCVKCFYINYLIESEPRACLLSVGTRIHKISRGRS